MWVLTNLASGGPAIIEPIFNTDYKILESIHVLLQNDDLLLFDQIMWFLSNAVADNEEYRNKILLKTSVLDIILNMTNSKIPLPIFKNIVWLV
jgi:hypothetical protein